MPLRITIELIPHGDESRKERLAVVECENDCTADRMGNGQVGNYIVTGQAHLYEEGWGEFSPLRVEGVRRYHYMPGDPDPIRDYMGTAAACLSALANAQVSQPANLSPLQNMTPINNTPSAPSAGLGSTASLGSVSYLYPLFEHMIKEHGLALVESELSDIADVAAPLSREIARLREALNAAHELLEGAVCDSINIADELEKWDRAFGLLLPLPNAMMSQPPATPRIP